MPTPEDDLNKITSEEETDNFNSELISISTSIEGLVKQILRDTKYFGEKIKDAIDDCKNNSDVYYMLLTCADPFFLALNKGKTHGHVISDQIEPEILSLSDHEKDVKNFLKYDFRNDTSVISGGLRGHSLQIRIDGLHNSENIYPLIPLLKSICDKKGLTFNIYDENYNKNILPLGLLKYLEMPPSRRRDLMKYISKSTILVPITYSITAKLYYNFGKGTRYISLCTLREVREKLNNEKTREEGIKAISALVELFTVNYRKSGLDVDLYMPDKGVEPCALYDQKLLKFRSQLVNLYLKFDKFSEDGDGALLALAYNNFLNSYESELPEFIRDNDIDSYKWLKKMYSILSNVYSNPFGRREHVEVIASFTSGKKVEGAFYHIKPAQLPEGISARNDGDVIHFEFGDDTIEYFNLDEQNTGLTVDILNSIDNADDMSLLEDGLYPDSFYLCKTKDSLDEKPNRVPERQLLEGEFPETYLFILYYSNGKIKEFEITNICQFKRYAEQLTKSFNKFKDMSDDDKRIFVLNYTDLQQEAIEANLEASKSEVLPKVQKVSSFIQVTGDGSETFFIQQATGGESLKDKSFIESLSNDELVSLFKQLAVMVASLTTSMASVCIEDVCKWKDGVLYLESTSTLYDPDNTFSGDSLASLKRFLAPQSLLPGYILSIRRNNGDTDDKISNLQKVFISALEEEFAIRKKRALKNTSRDEFKKSTLYKSTINAEDFQVHTTALFNLKLYQSILLTRSDKIDLFSTYKKEMLKNLSFFREKTSSNKNSDLGVSSDTNFDLLRRYASILSLISFENKDSSHVPLITTLDRLTSDEYIFKKNPREERTPENTRPEEEVKKREVALLDIIYIGLTLEVLSLANRLKGSTLQQKKIPTLGSIINLSLRANSVREFRELFNKSYAYLRISNEKLTRFYNAYSYLKMNQDNSAFVSPYSHSTDAQLTLLLMNIDRYIKIDDNFSFSAKTKIVL